MIVNSDRDKTPEQLCDEKEKRVHDAIKLKMTDRVPIICGFGYFPAKYVGIPCSAAYYDYKAWFNAYKKTLQDFPADMIHPEPFTPGKALEILEPKPLLWPGHGIDPKYGHQTIEVDNMRADEYDAFIKDPSDYMFRIHMSRVSAKLSGLATLPKLSDLRGWRATLSLAEAVASPEASRTFRTLLQAGNEMRRWRTRIKKFDQMMKDVGFPPHLQGSVMPPYDIMSHSIRGMSGTMVDMYRQPDKLIKACEKLAELALARPLPKPTKLGNIRIFMTNTRGSDDFISKKHFDTFYWPTFKIVVQDLIDRGATPCIFFEGNCLSRLEYMLDFPKGRILARLDTTDIVKAKEILKGHVCIQGNVPSTLLQVGSVQDVKDYCKNLIDTMGKHGGFILSPRSSTDEVKPENLKAMIDFTQEYGVYN